LTTSDQQSEFDVVGSIEMIAVELKDGDDVLAEWATKRPKHFISNDDTTTQGHFGEILQLVYSRDYNKGSRDNFLSKADPWLIAKAKTIGATVVTHEARILQGNKVKVPDICDLFEVPCIGTFDLLRVLKARFINSTSVTFL